MKKQIVVLCCLLLAASVTAVEKVACIGDSITFGSGIKDRVKDAYPVQLQALLGKGFEVKNFGNPGRGIIKTSMRGRGKRAFIFMKEHTAALKFKADILICNLGINDLMDFPKKGNDKAFVKDYIELINAYRAKNKKVRIILWAPLGPLYKGQRYHKSPTVKEIHSAIKKVIKQLNAEGKKNGWPVVESIDMNKPLSGKAEMFPDHIHPNATGAKIIAVETYKKMKSLKLLK